MQAHASEDGAPHGDHLLKVLSYNIHGLPEPLVGDFGQYDRIGEILSKKRSEGIAPEIVVLQEGFTDNVTKLIAKTGYPHVKAGPEGGFLQLSSGLWVLSEYPILETHTMSYSRCIGMDCYARKGAIHARFTLPGSDRTLDLYTTHLNANNGGNPFVEKREAVDVRMSQANELAEFIRATRTPGSFVLAPGDYNMGFEESDYAYLGSLTQFQDAGFVCSTNKSCSFPEDLIGSLTRGADRHFFLQTPGSTVIPLYLDRNFREKIEDKALSDHRGYEVHYHLSW